MPTIGQGWEFHMVRQFEQWNSTHTKKRTVGRYQIFHNGVRQTGQFMSGMFAETKGPGDNSAAGNNRRIEEGTYTLRTQGGTKYKTFGYSSSTAANASPKPGMEVKGCAPRSEIIIHPGQGFLASIGCINPCTSLPTGAEPITYSTSRSRVISIIEDLKAFLGNAFPSSNERPIPNAFVVIDGEPSPPA